LPAGPEPLLWLAPLPPPVLPALLPEFPPPLLPPLLPPLWADAGERAKSTITAPATHAFINDMGRPPDEVSQTVRAHETFLKEKFNSVA
jgi:hypothetical protein